MQIEWLIGLIRPVEIDLNWFLSSTWTPLGRIKPFAYRLITYQADSVDPEAI